MCYRDSLGEAPKDRLHPWCVVRLLPNMQRTIVARFRRRGNAEEQLKILNRMMLTVTYLILFDAGLN